MAPFFLNGAPGKIRTPDPLVRSQVLCPTELQAQRSYRLIESDLSIKINFRFYCHKIAHNLLCNHRFLYKGEL